MLRMTCLCSMNRTCNARVVSDMSPPGDKLCSSFPSCYAVSVQGRYRGLHSASIEAEFDVLIAASKHCPVTLEILPKAVTMEITVSWDMTPCRFVPMFRWNV